MHYIVRNERGNEISIYPWRKGFMFVDKEFGYRPKPQQESKIVEKRWYKHHPFYRNIFYAIREDNWFLRDGYWWERVEIKPRCFRTVTGLSITKFDNLPLDIAVRSCIDEMNAYGNTYPDAFVVDKDGERILE